MRHPHLCVIHLYYSIISFLHRADTTWVSTGAGSALNSHENTLVAKPSGCGSHYSLRRYSTFHFISGQRVSGRSTKSTGFVGGILIKGLDTKRGGQHLECFCKPSPPSRVVNPTHRYRSSSSYPLAYSLIVLPFTIARYLQFGHHNVPSAVTFFGASIFYLSGAINVLLFLIIRPQLLLLPRPEELVGQEIQLTYQGAGPAIISDTPQLQFSPERTSTALGVPSATPSGSKSSRMSDDI